MQKTWDIRVRVSKIQLEKLRSDALAKGFQTVSSYMRYMCLEHKQTIEGKIIENNEILKAIKQKLLS